MTSLTGAERPEDLVAAYSGLLGSVKRTQARKAVRELVALADDGSALKLAAALAPVAALAPDTLVRLWPQAHDPDGFAAALLAPAFREEGRTELKLQRVNSLAGLRHLVMLRRLTVERCKEISDLTELESLTELRSLNLNGCAGVEDLTPLSGLTQLTWLSLHRCRPVRDVKPLLTLSRLRHLDLSITRVTSVDGFAASFPLLEKLDLRGCRSFRSPSQLSGLTRLTHLDLGWTAIRNLSGPDGRARAHVPAPGGLQAVARPDWHRRG
ncbi:leucine-rich repeat domain-containing protein [Streptomyces parvus]|uniref:leucine-rich repeat domain-containing protein n=1 Tax=Streptomyces parvus TaxID=66428 RepID=UPI0021012A32|nr:hypothetical protein [Streptomyces parvus]MCQ1581094.1 hypothetical protein [Streptomyces parvus]